MPPPVGWKQRRTDPLGLSLARRLLEMRQKRGETQLGFARRFEISVGTYARWEKYGPPRHPLIRRWIYNKLDNLRVRERDRGKKGG